MQKARLLYKMLVISLIILTNACSQRQAMQNPPTGVKKAQTVAKTKALSAWRIEGAMSIRTPEDSTSARFTWKQHARQSADVYLFVPISGQIINISQRPGRASLKLPNKDAVHAPSARALLRQQTGLDVPVENMMYWIRGLPVPNQQSKKTYNSKGRVETLSQGGWHIEYTRYNEYLKDPLPKRMLIRYGNLTIKLIVRQWKI